MKIFLAMACLGLAASAALAQQPAGVAVHGIIAQRETGEAIWGANVELRKEGGTSALYGAVTDPDGKFAFPSVPQGRYQLLATSQGYVPAEYGQKRMKGAGLPLIVANQPLPNVRIEMVPTGAIAGRVTDSAGQPIAIADVFALKSTYQEGQRILTQVLSAKTDERGEFRMFWLTPGTYYLNVVVPDGTNQANLIMNSDGFDNGAAIVGVRTILRDVLSRPIGTGATENEAHVPIYYPSTANPQQARAIDVRPGEDIRNISLTVGVARTFHVRGVVNGIVTGGSANGRLVALDPAWPAAPVQVDSATGKFDVGRVVSGPYILYIQLRPPNATGPQDASWASMPLEMREQDIDNLTIVTRPGVPIAGKVVVDGPQPDGLSPAAGLFLGMRPDPLVTQQVPSPSTRVSNDGTFIMPGIILGTYRIYAPPLLSPVNPGLLSGLPPVPPALLNTYVKTIRVNGADVLDSGVRIVPSDGMTMEIVLGIHAGSFEGRVVHGGQPVAEATVGILPNTVAARGFRTDMHKSTLTDSSGKFQFRGLPPGEYKIFAWEEADKDAIMDLDFVRSHEERGTRLSIAEGENKGVELSLISARVQ